MSGKIVAGARSLVFMLFFYPVTALFVLLCALFAPFSARMLRRCGRLWGQTHRVLCRVVLGQRVRILGTLPQEPMLYVFKHESMFETVDVLCLFAEPPACAKPPAPR